MSLPQSNRAKYFVLDIEHGTLLYTSNHLSQAMGFVDGHEGRSIITTALVMMDRKEEWKYRISIIDEESGRVLAQGPEIDLFEADAAMMETKLVLLPSCGGRPALMKGGQG